jgi:hypothetical protein
LALTLIDAMASDIAFSLWFGTSSKPGVSAPRLIQSAETR